jgi:hypothetical protein
VPPIPAEQCSPYGPASQRQKPQADDDIYLNSRQLRQRYGDASAMWVHRRLKNDPRFPRPIIVAKRRFWKLSALIAWERQAAATA